MPFPVLVPTLLAACFGLAEPPAAFVPSEQHPPNAREALAPDITDRLEVLGHPLAGRYPDGSQFHYARTICDLQAFEGKLYLGYGDFKRNSGPTDIWYYDLKDKVFVKQDQIEDEVADHYRVIDGRLYLPGMDPTEDWSLGNFYRLEDGRWIKHRTLPDSVHSADIVGLNHKLYALSARPKPPMCLLESSDDGKTWHAYDAPSGESRIEGRLILLEDRLYLTTVGPAGEVKLSLFNGTGFDACPGEMLPGAERPVRTDPGFQSWSALEKPTSFRGRLAYIGVNRRVNFREQDLDQAWPPDRTLGLFVATATEPTRFAVARTTVEGTLTDIAADEGRLYVVGYRWKQEGQPAQRALSTVFASADLTHWSKLFSLEHESFVSALEVIDGDFYLGLGGTRQHCAPSTGMIVKVRKEQLESH
jgi:hypothetical protein